MHVHRKEWEEEMKASVLFAQIIFGILGIFFTVGGIVSQMSYRPSIWSSGPQPIVTAFIGLPLIAIAVALNVLHKKDDNGKKLQISVRCPVCGHLNAEEAKFCGKCAAAQNPPKIS